MRTTVSTLLSVLLIACASSQSYDDAESAIRLQSGSTVTFAGVRCFSTVDIHDVDDTSVTLVEFERQIVSRGTGLVRCTGTEDRRLQIAYQAGRGVCIDCELPKDRWAGFAFITVVDPGEKELASAEWQGSRERDGHALLRRFTDDVANLVRRDRGKESRSVTTSSGGTGADGDGIPRRIGGRFKSRHTSMLVATRS